MIKSAISPSMMCADIFKLTETIAEFEKNGIEYLHIDIMDGQFVPNFCLGTDYIKQLKAHTGIPLDIHIMAEKPELNLDVIPYGAGDIVSVHVESTAHLQKVLAKIRSNGALAFAVLNPATPLSSLDEVLDDIDGVMLMTVNPGFAGQKLITSSFDKLRRLRKKLDESGHGNVRIEVDGNITVTNAKLTKEAGADLFVVGTSGLFSKGDLTKGIADLREVI